MKLKKIIYKIMIVMLFICLGCSGICYAEEPKLVQSDELGLPMLTDEYKPSITSGSKAEDIISTLLSVLTGVGIIAIVVGVAIIGFNTILGSASEKAIAQEKYIGLVIAALLITGGSIIAKMLISVAEKF